MWRQSAQRAPSDQRGCIQAQLQTAGWGTQGPVGHRRQAAGDQEGQSPAPEKEQPCRPAGGGYWAQGPGETTAPSSPLTARGPRPLTGLKSSVVSPK